MGSELGGGQKWGRELGLGYVVRGILSWVHLGLGASCPGESCPEGSCPEGSLINSLFKHPCNINT